MGLDTSHDCWHGAYSSFNTFRKRLANEININLDECIGYGDGSVDLTTINHGIIPLLNHSDCDGILTVEESKQILVGLNDILNKMEPLNEDNTNFLENKWFRNKIIQFIKGLELAIERNEVVDFH